MAKSKIIKELTSGTCSLTIAMKRLYVILSDLNDEDLILWVKKELNGYSDEDELPSYRKVKCSPIGSYQIIECGHLITYNGQPLPMIDFDDELKKIVKNAKMTMSISAIVEALKQYKKGKAVGNPIAMELWPYFENGTNITITGANRIIDETEVRKVLDNIESKVLDVLIYLEKKFGNLDELDIDGYSEKDLADVAKSCKQIIYQNCTFQSLNNAKIKSKNIATDNSKIDNKKSKTVNKNSNTGKGNNYVEKHTDINADIKSEVNIEQSQERKKKCWLKNLFHKKEN